MRAKAAAAPVPGLTYDEYRDSYMSMLRDRIKANEARINAFRDGLAKDAYEALEWSNESFRVAARLHVERLVLSALEKAWQGPDGLKAFAARITEEAMRGARYPSHSTSAPANYAVECRTAAWAEYAEELTALAVDAK